MKKTRQRVQNYITEQAKCGYGIDIPDEVPYELMCENLAPSYKAIAFALLQNDMHLVSLGYAPPDSYWYGELKKIEISARCKGLKLEQILFEFMFHK